VFYFVCAVIALFCLIALGFGPSVFVLAGASLAVLGFRSRLRRWWGLPMAAAGVALAASVMAGWGWHQVVETTGATFLAIAAVRAAGRLMSRRMKAPRRSTARPVAFPHDGPIRPLLPVNGSVRSARPGSAPPGSGHR
jgi:hypothetical protein